MVRDSVRDRGAADARAARRAEMRDIPYRMQLARDGSVVLAVCTETGDSEAIDNEDAPTTCPVCGTDGRDVDECTGGRTARADADDAQAALTAFEGGDD